MKEFTLTIQDFATPGALRTLRVFAWTLQEAIELAEIAHGESKSWQVLRVEAEDILAEKAGAR